MATEVTNKRARQAAGAAAGVVVYGGGSVAAGLVASKAIGRVAAFAPVQAIGARFVAAAPKLATRLPVIGTGVALGLSAWGLYQAVRPVVAMAQDAREKRRGRDTTNVQPSPVRRPGEVEPSRKAKRKDGDARPAAPAAPVAVSPQGAPPVAAQPPAAPPSAWSDIKKDLGGLVASNPEFARRRAALERTREIIDTQLAKGSTLRPDTLQAQKENQKALDDLAKEERDNNPLKAMMATVGPIAALAGGYVIGGWMAGKAVAKAGEEGAKVASQVEKLGRSAGELMKVSPKGVIAGTTTGDKAKALVNTAYSLGGAKSAFPSPGFPSPPTPTILFGNGVGLPTRADYVVAGFNVTAGAVEFGSSFAMSDESSLKPVARFGGALEFGVGLAQWKALAGVRPTLVAQKAISGIDGLRNRIVRETATRSPNAVAQTRAAANATLAHVQASRTTGIAGTRANAALGVEANLGRGRVAASRISAHRGAVRAGADLGVAKADGAGRVARAEARAKLGPPKAYKNTWQDKNGKIYHRRDMTVRAANSNSPPARRKAN